MKFKNFKLASYLRAYEICEMTDKELGQKLDEFMSKVHTDKIYIENHRGQITIPIERLKSVKSLVESRGLIAAGGITCTSLVNNIRKPAIFDTYCYTDPAHRKEALSLFSDLASVFDEIILDDFFFTACRCEMCINAKGKRSWKEYRLDLMEQFADESVKTAKAINPNVRFIIKYPNWYESYQEAGFNPEKQKDIFDGIFTGTETRTPYIQQHLQRYESFSIMRLMEHIAPNRNGGGWIDPFGSEQNMSYLIEQAEATLLGKAKELMLWNLVLFNKLDSINALGQALIKIDNYLSILGNPVGVKTWEPYNGDGEDQLYNYLGMCGLAINPYPEFPKDATTVLYTESTAEREDSMEILENYVRNGGNAIVTLGYFKKMYDKGIKDLTSARLTGRHVIGSRYMIQNANSWNTVTEYDNHIPVMYEIISYKTNSTHSDISLVADEHNFPIMTEDNYGKGRFFILNVPENFADLYKLPLEVVRNIAKHMSMGQDVYVGSTPKLGFYPYDNNVYVMTSYSDKKMTPQIVVRGESKGIKLINTGKVITNSMPLPLPNHMADGVTDIYEEPEFAFTVDLNAGETILFEVVREY